MNRRKFIQSTLLGTATFFIPNAVLAFGKNHINAENLTDAAKKTLFTQPDLKDYKFNTDGTAFFKTQVGFTDQNSKQVFLPGDFRITQDQNGFGTPTLFFDGKDHYIFVNELFLGYKMNGWVYKYNRREGFTAQQIYQHENMGWYAFWGKTIDGQPALYHYEFKGGFMWQTTPVNGVWTNNKIFNTVPGEAITLYNSQLNHADYHTQANQFGFEYKIHRDGFYDFLKLKHDWEQGLLKKEKDLAELEEKKKPTLLSSLENSPVTRTIRNRQSLANSGCCGGCAEEKDTATPDNICIVKTQNLKISKINPANGETVYQTKLGFYDARNVYHEMPDVLYCPEDAFGEAKPVLYSDGDNYFLYTNSFERGEQQGFLYKYNKTDGLQRESVSNVADWGLADFATHSKTNEPIHYSSNQIILKSKETQAKWVKAEYEGLLNRASESALLINNIIDGKKDEFRYTNPFVPIYCVGDDTSRAIVKPTVIYKEIEGTKIEIPNMPAIKMQDELGDCRAFSLAAILQKYTCDRLKIDDCQNPPANRAISYFGLLAYTNRSVESPDAGTFQPNQDNSRTMYDIITSLSNTGNYLIPESCNPLDKVVENVTDKGQAGLTLRDKFFSYLKNIYDTRKNADITKIEDCQSCLDEIKKWSTNVTMENLKKALTKDSFDAFLYGVFFKGCKMVPFPAGFSAMAYPILGYSLDGVYHEIAPKTETDFKAKIIEGLKKGKPVLFPYLCTIPGIGQECKEGHSLVISGYKQVAHPKDKKIIKDLFKSHNSWGEDWQKINNNGWVDADELVHNTRQYKDGDKYKLLPGCVIWLEP